MITIETVAQVVHTAVREFCLTQNDTSIKPWAEAEQWQRSSSATGVLYRLANPNATPEDQHNEWMKYKRADGWKYGTVKDSTKKEHPCMVPYDDLPDFQKVKDYIVVGVVDAFRPFVTK